MNNIKRETYLQRIRPYYKIDLIKVISGVRRCGKSVILGQIVDEISRNVPFDHIISINFEDYEFSGLEQPSEFYKYVKNSIKDSDKYYMFFDEIQHVREFEKVIASFKATMNCSVFITGSNSSLLSGEFATLLVGRTAEFKIMPFSYSEAVDFFQANGREMGDDFIFDYIKRGGLPQRFDFNEPEEIKRYIESVFAGIVEKDIYKRNSEIEKYKFSLIAGYILSNAGREFSAENTVNYFNSRNELNKKGVEKKTVYNYIEKLEKAFLISRVKRYNITGKRMLESIEKHYVVDPGFKTVCSTDEKYQDTFLLENVVFNELISTGYRVYTGKTYNSEIDFVVMNGNKKCFIQVAYLLSDEETVRREFAFSTLRDASPKYVLSLDKPDFSHDGVTHINIIDFLSHRVKLFLS